MRRVVLSKSEVEKLTDLYNHSHNSVERKRSHCLLLSNQNRSVTEVAQIVSLTAQTVSSLFTEWESAQPEARFSVLRYAKGQGAKRKLEPVKELIPTLLEKYNRNIKLVLYEIEKEHNIKVHEDTLSNFLNTQGYKYKRVRKSLKTKRNEQQFVLQSAELNKFIEFHKQDYIDLYYADGSHFSLVPNVRSCWQRKGEEILLPATRSTALSLFGIMSLDCDLHFEIHEGTLNSEKIIAIFDQFVKHIRKQTIVVIDNAPVHKSKLFKQKVEEWKEQDLYIYYLPPYSPELNKIEILWRFIKYLWLPLDAYTNILIFKERLIETLQNVGTKYKIEFN